MSHFYGAIQGTRGRATRCGDKRSGLTTSAASWSGAILVDIYRDTGEDVDRYTVASGVLGKAPAAVERRVLMDLLTDGVNVVQHVSDTWNEGDLAGAVNQLEHWRNGVLDNVVLDNADTEGPSAIAPAVNDNEEGAA